MSDKTRDTASLKKVRIFKDLKIQESYEKIIDGSKSEVTQPKKEISEAQLAKLRKAQELAAQYFGTGAVRVE